RRLALGVVPRERDLRRVRRARWRGLAVDVLSVREEVHVPLLAVLLLRGGPLPHVPGDLVRTGFVRSAPCLVYCRGWIQPQIFGRHLAELAIRRTLERIQRHARAAAAGQTCVRSADSEVCFILIRSG